MAQEHETIQTIQGLISQKSQNLVKENIKVCIKKKHAKVTSINDTNNTVQIHFIDSSPDFTFWFKNKTGTLLNEGDNVWVEYTSNPAKGQLKSFGKVNSNETNLNASVTAQYAYGFENRLPTAREYEEIPINSLIAIYENSDAYDNLTDMRFTPEIYYKTETLKPPGSNVMTGVRPPHVWTARQMPERNIWSSVTYGNGNFNYAAYVNDRLVIVEVSHLFVAVSQDGTNRIMTSSDGITWVSRTAPERNSWTCVAYGKNLFIAVSEDGTNRVMTSSDGITWMARQAAQQNRWQSVTYGDGLFVAVSRDGTNRIMTSPDGINWTARNAPQSAWQSVTYGNGLFVAVAESGTNRVMTSSDGINWTARQAAEENWWRCVTYGNDLFVAVSSWGANQVMTSPDGINWTARQAAAESAWNSITYGDGLFVAVSYDSATSQVMTSPDGINWTARQAAARNWWWSVTYGNGLFVAVSSDGINRVMTLNHNLTWTIRQSAENNNWRSVTYGNGLFVAVSSDGINRIMTSHDGINWTARRSAAQNNWRSVTYGNDLFVAVSSNGVNRIMTSPDGINWTAREGVPGIIHSWSCVTYANGKFIAVADNYVGWTRWELGSWLTSPGAWTATIASPDGINWYFYPIFPPNIGYNFPGNTYGFNAVAGANGMFITVGSAMRSANNLYPSIASSSDGMEWTVRENINPGLYFLSIAHGNNRFIAAGRSDHHYFSPLCTAVSVNNGFNWTKKYHDSQTALMPLNSVIYSIVYGEEFVIVGENAVTITHDGETYTALPNIPQGSWISVTYGNGIYVAVGLAV